MTDQRPPRDENQGEGDRASARRYNEHVREFIRHDDPAKRAEEAKAAVEGPEGEALREAEERGVAAAELSAGERLLAAVNRARNGLARALARLSERVAVSGHAGHPS